MSSSLMSLNGGSSSRPFFRAFLSLTGHWRDTTFLVLCVAVFVIRHYLVTSVFTAAGRQLHCHRLSVCQSVVCLRTKQLKESNIFGAELDERRCLNAFQPILIPLTSFNPHQIWLACQGRRKDLFNAKMTLVVLQLFHSCSTVPRTGQTS